jgi:metal-responsive CopG/Arc/MetJ family transcriptional regulator
MAIIKTAVSIESGLFKKAEKAAQNLKVSRSRLFALALENYITQLENLLILKKINSVYPDTADRQEQDFKNIMKTYHINHQGDNW